MATPRIQLEVITDFLLRAGKIDSEKVISQIRKQVEGISIPEVRLDTLLDVSKLGQTEKAIARVNKAIAGIDKTLAGADRAVDQRLAKFLESDVGKQVFPKGLPPDLSDNIKQGLQDQLGAYRAFYDQLGSVLKTPFDERAAGRGLKEANDILRQISQKRGDITKYSKEDLNAARLALNYDKQRLAQLRKLRTVAAQQFPKFYEQGVDPETGAAFTRARTGVAPLALTGLDDAISQYERLEKASTAALEPGRADKLADSLSRLQQRLAGTKKGTLTNDLKDLQRQLSTLAPNTKGFDELQGKIKQLQDSAAKQKDLYSTARQTGDFLERERLVKNLGDLEKRTAAEVGKVRSEIDAKVAKQRERDFGKYIKTATEFGGTSLKQAEKDVQRKIFKGAKPTPEVAIQGISNLSEAAAAASLFDKRMGQAAASVLKYAGATGEASEANKKRLEEARKAYDEAERLKTLAADKERRLRSDTLTAGGQRRVQAAALDIQNRKRAFEAAQSQLNKLEQRALSGAIQGVDPSAYLKSITDLRGRLNTALQGLDKAAAAPDLAERNKQMDVLKAGTKGLAGEVLNLGKAYDQQYKNQVRAEQQAQKKVESDRVAQQKQIEAERAKIARKTYGVDTFLDKSILEGLDVLRRRNVENIQGLRATRDALAATGQTGTDAYRKIQGEVRNATKEHLNFLKATRQYRQQIGPFAGGANLDDLKALAAQQYIEAERIIKQAGGAKGLARSLGGISREDKGRLPVIRDVLQRDLSRAQVQVDTMLASGVSRLSPEFKKASTEAHHLQRAVRRVNVELKGYYTLTAQTGALFRQFARYGLGYAALYRVLYGFRALAGGVTELDTALISIKAVTQSTDKQMATIEKTIKRVATTTQFTTGEIAQAAQVLAQAGVEAKDFPKSLTAVAAFASATQSSMEISADLVSTVRNVYKELDDVDIANQLTRAVNISKLTAQDLKTILSLSAQMGKAYNLASDQYLAAVTTLRNAGIKASTVATGLRQALIEIFSPDNKTLKVLQKRYKELGEDRSVDNIRNRFFSFTQDDDSVLSVLRELRRVGFGGAAKSTFSGRTFDVRAENAVNALISNLEGYVQDQAKIVFGNAAITSSQTQMEALSNNLKNLGAALTTVTHDLSQDLIPRLTELVKGTTSAVDAIGKFDQQLRISSGNTAGEALTGGLVAGALAAKGVRAGTRLSGAIAQTAVGAAAGTYVSAKAQEAAAEKGLSQGFVTAAGDIAGVLTGVLFLMAGRIKDLFGKLFFGPKSGQLSFDFKDVGKTAATGISRVTTFFKGLWAAFQALTPMGKALRIIAGASTAAYLFFSRWRTEEGNIRKRLKEANQAFEGARGERDTAEQQLVAYRRSDATTGYEAPEGTIAGKSEELTDDLAAYSELLVEYFGTAGELSKKAADDVTEILRDLERYGAQEGQTRNQYIRQLEEVTGLQITGDPQRQEQVNQIQALLAKIDNSSTGLFDNLKERYQAWSESQAHLKDTVEGAAARALRQAVQDQGLGLQITGHIEATTEQIRTLFEQWLKLFAKAIPNIKELTDTAAGVTQSLNARLTLQLARLKEIEEEERKRANRRTTRQANRGVRRRTAASIEEQERRTEEGRREEVIAQNPPVLSPAEARVRQEEIYNLQDRILGVQAQIDAILQGPDQIRVQHGRTPGTRDVDKSGEIEQLQKELDLLELSLDRKVETANAYDASVAKQEESLVEGLVNHANDLKLIVDRANQRVPHFEQALKILQLEQFKGISDQLIPLIRQGRDADVRKLLESFVGTKEDQYGVKIATQTPESKAFFEQVGRIVSTAPQLPTPRRILFEETGEFVKLRQALSEARNEVTRFKNAKNFEKLQDALVQLRDSELAIAKANLAFLRRQGPGEGATDSQINAHKAKIIQQEEDIRRLEEKYQAERIRVLQQQLGQTQAQTKAELDSLKKLSVDAAESPYFSAFGDITSREADFQRAVDQHARALADSLILSGEDVKSVELRIAAFRAEHRSLLEFSDAIKKATEATESYNDALAKIRAADAVGTAANVGLEVIKRDYNIEASPEARRVSVTQQAEAEKRALDANLKAYAQLAAQLTQAQRENAPGQVIAELTEKLALMEDQLQDNVDRMAELRKEARAINLDLLGELNKGFSPQGILSDIRANTEAEVSSLGDTVRKAFEDAFDGVSDVITDAIFGDLEGDFLENLDKIVTSVFRELAKDIVKAAVKTALTKSLEGILPTSVTQLISPQQLAAGNAVVTPSQAAAPAAAAVTAALPATAGVFGGAQAPLFPDATSAPATAALFGGLAPGGSCPINDSCFQSLFDAVDFGNTVPAAEALSTGGGFDFSNVGDVEFNADLPTEQVAEVQQGFFDKFLTNITDFFGSIGDTLAGAFDKLKGGLGSLLDTGKGLLSGVLGFFGLPGFAMTGGTFSSSGTVQKPLRRAGGGLLDRLRGSDKVSAVQRNFESEKKEQREMLGEALEDKLQEEGILKRGMGGMIRLMRRGRGGTVDDMSLGDAIRRPHGGVIRGPGTGTSDSIPGVIVDSSGRPQRGVLVSNGEAILNAKATAKLGKPTIDWLNTNAEKLANGGMVGAGLSKIHEATRSVVGESTRTRLQEREKGMNMYELQEAMRATLASQEPAKMRLEVSESALQRTLRDHIEEYWADVVATR